MNNLPNEVIIEIFNNLDDDDLFNVALVCKKFNEIVSNTPAIMDKFEVEINKNKSHFITSRKYRRMFICFIDENIVKLIQHIGENIISIFVLSKVFQLSDLKKILIACSNLKKLRIQEFSVFENDDDLNEPLPKLQLDSLDITNSNAAFKILLASSVKKLDFDTIDGNREIMHSFIQKQNHLHSLGVHFCDDFFDNVKLTDVEFRLEILRLSSPELKGSENFQKFLQQQNRLYKVGIVNGEEYCTEGLNLIGKCKNIKELRLSNVNFEFNPMPFIETLSIDNLTNVDYRKFHKLFPNVTTLILTSIHSIKIVADFFDEKRKEIKIPNVKSLTMKEFDFGHECPFECNNIKAEHLKIEKCNNANWLNEWLRNNEIKLKSLRIFETKMRKSVKQYLDSLTVGDNKRIEMLEIKDNE